MGQPLNDPTIEDPTKDDPDLIDSNDDDEPEPEWTPPTKEAWEKQQADLRRAREQAKKLREAKKPADAPAPETEPDRRQTRTERAVARAALISAGVDPDVAAVTARTIRGTDITWDDDDEADVSDWVEDLRERRPGLFRKTANGGGERKLPRLNRGQGGAGKPEDKLSFGEKVRENSKKVS